MPKLAVNSVGLEQNKGAGKAKSKWKTPKDKAKDKKKEGELPPPPDSGWVTESQQFFKDDGGNWTVPQLLEFDLGMINEDATCVLVGKRRKGKSFLARHILWSKKHLFPFGCVFTTTKFNGFWQKMIPDEYIFDGYDEEKMDKIIQRQMKYADADGVDPRIFVVLDDIVSEKGLRYSQSLYRLFYNGRHLKIFLIITSQYAYSLPPGVRSNTDFCFIFKTRQKRQVDALAEDFVNNIPKEVFIRLLETHAGDNNCLVVDTVNDESDDVTQQIFTFKAIDPGDFIMGCPEFWGMED